MCQTVTVCRLADLPKPDDDGMITLQDNTTYYFPSGLDLNGNRLVCGTNNVIMGASSENSRLTSTGLVGTALITSAYSLPMRFIAIEADTALSLAATTSDQALDWFGVNFVDTPTVGTISGFSNFIMSDCAFLNSAGLTFDGTVGTIGFQTCLFDGRTGSTTITIAPTATITRRFRAVQCAFVCLAGETAINFSTDATCPVEGFILGTVNFGGGGTYIAGVQHDDVKSQFYNVRGVTNSASVASYYMQGNVTATTVGSSNTFVKVAGTTSSGTYVQRFTLTNNKATYAGALDLFFQVMVIGTISAQNNRQIAFRIAVNETTLAESQMATNSEGLTRSAPLYVQSVVELSTGDFVEVYVANLTDGTAVTVEDLHVVVHPLS